MGLFKKVTRFAKKIIAGEIDTKDRKKIAERTKTAHFNYRLSLDGEPSGKPFSLLVLGDSGAKGEAKNRVGTAMSSEQDIAFVLHLGDVVYLSGSKEGYPKRVITPYKHWLANKNVKSHKELLFNTPFLPIYGNHDYFDFANVPLIGDIAGKISDEIGSGSHNGRVFEEAFVQADASLVNSGTLDYIPNKQTRIPNRYYWFTYENCAFIALDSNTLDGVKRLEKAESKALWLRRELARARAKHYERLLEVYEDAVEEKKIKEGAVRPLVDDLLEELAETQKEIVMLKKALKADPRDYDEDQLKWLRQILDHDDVKKKKWKIVYLHHPLYTSEQSHTDDPESIGLRKNLREIFVKGGVQLVLTGHSHCFEWLARKVEEDDPLAGERKICYIISGGGGRELRQSVLEVEIPALKLDDFEAHPDRIKQLQFLDVAESKAFTAYHKVNGQDEEVYHYLRIDVGDEVLKVFPMGVLEKEGVPPLSPIPIKRLLPQEPVADEDRPATMRSIDVVKTELRCINVFPYRAPEPEPAFES